MLVALDDDVLPPPPPPVPPHPIPPGPVPGPGHRRRRDQLTAAVVVAVPLAILVAGLAVTRGGGDPEASRPPDYLRLSDLEPALLTEDDVGRGFVAQTGTPDVAPTGIPDDADVSPGCRRALERFESFESDVDGGADPIAGMVSVDFERPDGTTLNHNLALMEADTPGTDEIAAGWSQCRRIEYEQDDLHYVQHVEADEVDGLGDGAAAIAITNDITTPEGNEVKVASYALVVVRDGVSFTVSAGNQVDPEQGSEPPDPDLVAELAAIGDAKLRQLLDA
jgi:hypothetical protein